MKSIRTTAKRLAAVTKRLHRDEQGAEGLEKLLIIAAIVLPMLGLLIFFRGAINDWVNNQWGEVSGDQGPLPTP